MLGEKRAHEGNTVGLGLNLGALHPGLAAADTQPVGKTVCGSEVEAQADAQQPTATHLCVGSWPPKHPISGACRGANRTDMNGTCRQYQFCYRHSVITPRHLRSHQRRGLPSSSPSRPLSLPSPGSSPWPLTSVLSGGLSFPVVLGLKISLAFPATSAQNASGSLPLCAHQ